jgi:hypothetical protein
MQEDDGRPTMKFYPDGVVAVVADVCFSCMIFQYNRTEEKHQIYLQRFLFHMMKTALCRLPRERRGRMQFPRLRLDKF